MRRLLRVRLRTTRFGYINPFVVGLVFCLAGLALWAVMPSDIYPPAIGIAVLGAILMGVTAFRVHSQRR